MTELDEFVLFQEDVGNYQALEAVRRFRKLSPEARERLRKKWLLEGRIETPD